MPTVFFTGLFGKCIFAAKSFVIFRLRRRHVGYKPEIADTEGEHAHDRPTDKAEVEQEKLALVALVIRLLSSRQARQS